MAGSDLMTLVVHTPRRAAELKKLLADHSVPAELVPFSLPGVDTPDCMEVRINPVALPVALKILESGGAYSSVKAELELSGSLGSVLIPVDFSPRSFISCRVGFALAVRLGLHPVVLHAFVSPLGQPLPDSLPAFQPEDAALTEEEEIREDIETRNVQEKNLRRFESSLKAMQAKGEIDAVDFSTTLVPGLPEEAISDYCRQNPPALIVMSTRHSSRKAAELVGSVTTEVLDSCRVPVFAIPEEYDFVKIPDIKNLIFFCDLDRQDIISMDTLMRMFDYPDVNITLIPVSDRAPAALVERLSALCKYLSEAYPTAVFSRMIFPRKTLRTDLQAFITKNEVQLLIVPNKKTNIFRRLFKPGIAHRLLFEGDMPVLALPV